MKYDVFRGGHYPHSYRISAVEHDGELSAVEVGYTMVPPGLKQILKRDVYAVHYIVSGKGSLEGKNELHRGVGYVLAPGETGITYADKDEPYEAYWVLFRGNSAREIMERCGLPEHNGVFAFDGWCECVELIKNALFADEPLNKWEESFLLQATLYRIIALHMRNARVDDSDVNSAAKQLKKMIDCDYYENLKIEMLAHRMNYSASYLYKAFKGLYGMSPQEYLLNVRIEKSKALLNDFSKKMSVGEISAMVGIQNRLYFSRLFKKKTGYSPTAFKNAKLDDGNG